jgi:hypothetical protein
MEGRAEGGSLSRIPFKIERARIRASLAELTVRAPDARIGVLDLLCAAGQIRTHRLLRLVYVKGSSITGAGFASVIKSLRFVSVM